jgi:tRNA (guanine37-N1)-methyltransferase
MDNKLKQISFLSIYPEVIEPYLKRGIFRAAAKSSFKTNTINLRDFAIDQQKTVDDKPYGGGEGMVMRCEPIAKALKQFKTKPRVILPSPQGKTWNQKKAQEYSNKYEHILFICPRFSGLDQRAIDLFVDEEISLGDYIISGGELAALVIADSITRHLPSALGNEKSVLIDSFSPMLDGKLEYPLYTRPHNFMGLDVPKSLLSGNHKKIKEWQNTKAQENTKEKRPDLL